MKTLITGGSGSIGRKLTRHLTQYGQEVIVLSRDPAKVTGLPKNARAVKWDGRTAEGWLTEADGADAIVNLAGENLAGSGFFPARWTDERKRAIRESRLNAGKAVAEAVAHVPNKPKLVIQSSAIGYYGPRGDEQLTETATAGNDYLANLCKEWEAATAPVEKTGVRRAIIRTGIYLTPDDGALKRLILPYNLFAGGPFGNGQQWYSWIHPDDQVEAIRFIIENQHSGIFNLTAPQPLKNKDFGKTLGKVLGRPSLIPIPRFALQTAFGEVVTVVFDGQRVVPQHLQDLGFTFKFPNLETALKDLLKK
ncbi:MAG: TIGR01777 family protein [Anaerolineales bacterium]|nr:TIGR01777 family protein [Anaerolineales bacterium]